jgi:hypothetical protein
MFWKLSNVYTIKRRWYFYAYFVSLRVGSQAECSVGSGSTLQVRYVRNFLYFFCSFFTSLVIDIIYILWRLFFVVVAIQLA